MSNLPHIVRQRLGAFSPGNAGAGHPDADLLTAFAERQLAAPERERVLTHLGTCAACREIVTLAAPETEIAQAAPTPARARSWWSIRSYQYGLVAATLALVAAGLVLLRPEAQRTSQPLTFSRLERSPATPNSGVASSDRPPADQAASDAERAKEQDSAAPVIADLKSDPHKKRSDAAVHAFTAGAVTVQKPGAEPPKELDKLADSSARRLIAGGLQAKRDVDTRSAYAVNEPAVLADTAAQRQQQQAQQMAPARGDRQTINVTSSDVPAAAPAKAAQPAQTTSAGAAVAHAGAPPAGTPQVRGGAAKDAYAPQTAEAASDAVTTEPAAATNSLISQNVGGAAGSRTAMQSAARTRAGALAKTEEEKQKALARDPNYSTRTATWRISNGRLQKLNPSRNAYDDVSVSGTSRLSVVGSLGTEVWVGGTDGALAYSNDQGAHWIAVSTGGWSKDATFTGLTPTALRSVEVRLSNGERWRSADAGASWSKYE